MSSITFFFIFIPILAFILLLVNLIFAPHNPYQEKDSPFECGYHSFLGQNRTQFNITFYIFGLCFLVFDLEILLLYPYAVSAYTNNIYGLIIALAFVLLLTIGLIYELGKGVLNISSRQSIFSLRYFSNISNENSLNFKILIHKDNNSSKSCKIFSWENLLRRIKITPISVILTLIFLVCS